jgi:multidrug resistance protein MdtO
MSARTAPVAAAAAGPPSVDEGNPPGGLALLRHEMAPTPGRLGNTLRMTALVLLSISLSEVFRLPEAALAAFIVLFVSREEASSTILSAAFAGVAVLLAIGLTIIVFMFSLAEPALRIPLVALFTFLAMFLSRASTLGPVVFAGGFILAYGLTLGDQVLQLSLLPATIGNTTAEGLPELAFMPPEEALVHFLLWLAAIVATAIGLAILFNILFGRDPAKVLRAGLLDRLDAAEDFCRGTPGAGGALAAFAREGTGGLLKLQHLATMLHHAQPLPHATALINATDRLGRVLLAWARLPETGAPRGLLQPAASVCADVARALRRQDPSSSAEAVAIPPARPAEQPSAMALPLIGELMRSLQAIAASAPGGTHSGGGETRKAPHRLLVPDAFTNPAYTRFAFKVTLAVMLCYLGENLLDWPGIHTCIITCFFVSLDTIGDTLHKATLRITGCLIGGLLGLAAILMLMPLMTDLGQLLAMVAAVTLLAAYVATGSQRIAYAGLQIALAFYLVVLQGFGPTLDMETARDRIVGILIGNVVVYVVFTTIWPVHIAPLVRRGLASALDQLASLIAIGEPSPDSLREAAERGFSSAIGRARALVVNDRLEAIGVPPTGGRRRIDTGLLAAVEGLMVPLSVILDLSTYPVARQLPAPARRAIETYHAAMADWFRDCSAWVTSGEGTQRVAGTLPWPPRLIEACGGATTDAVADHLAAREAWYGLLRQDIAAILARVGVQAAEAFDRG